MDELQQRTEGWVGLTTEELVDRLPRYPHVVGYTANALDPKLFHPMTQHPGYPIYGNLSRAITRERTPRCLDVCHYTARLSSYNMVVQARVIARATAEAIRKLHVR